MKIYNSLTDKLEVFKPINEGHVTMYVCGPTVYNYVHIGNMRPVITFDMIYNYFKYLGYDVTYASNFTDINPKIITAALELGLTEREIANKFIKAYLEDLEHYNCSEIDLRPRVIDYLGDIINFINKLIETGYAYEINGDVYFRINKIKDYGLLSNQNINDLEAGSRVEINEQKENPLDFVLWRKTTEGEQFNSPWGKGMPGWHTECVVMVNSLFGGKIDIHGGGIDLKFPHHENEIAQACAYNNHHLANYWIHNGHINVDGEKMSKSLDNFILARDFLKLYQPNIIKIALFKTHYRLPLNFTDELFSEAKLIDEKINNVLKQANTYININNLNITSSIKIPIFEEYMNDDFNTPNVLTYLLDLIKDLNLELRGSNNNIDKLTGKILIISNILGLKYEMKKWTEDDINNYLKWTEYRNNKDYSNADIYRNKLTEKNLI